MLIFRILVCAQYPGIRELLFAEFERSDCDNRWQIGDMLYETADRSCFRRYSEISADARYGSDRQMIVLIFGKLRLYEAKPLLVALLDDETVYGHALDSLSRICDEGDICHFQRFADSGQIWVRKTARKFLRRYGVSESDALSVPLCIKR